MATYLLRWNSDPDAWENLDSARSKLGRGIAFDEKRWKATSLVTKGSRLFLTKQSAEPCGIIAAGYAIDDSYRDEEEAWRVAFQVEALSLEFPLPFGSLRPWNALRQQSSGITVPVEFAADLEKKWAAHIRRHSVPVANRTMPANPSNSPDVLLVSDDNDDLPTEGKERVRLHKVYERSLKLRGQKISEARKKDPRLKCEVCGFSFTKLYGDLGSGFIECHHIQPVREGPRETSLDDLALVCSNCHRMLHRSGLIEIKELRSMVDRNRVAR